MELKLVKSPDPWLSKQVDPFNFNFLNAKEVERQMVELMLQEGGLGLSANQVSINAQIFVIKPYLLGNNVQPFAMINPEIKQVSQEVDLMPEGCLSHPNLYLSVKRPKVIIVKYLDTDANECIIELCDIDARCFLHEYDHLYGIEFTDRVSKLRLDRALKKQKKIRNNNNG
tara:strand:- start:1640 stop:2152 length:513 start_codon:yes stop_codon:yes gene_type:complete